MKARTALLRKNRLLLIFLRFIYIIKTKINFREIVMMRKLVDVLLLVFSVGTWLYTCHMEERHWVYVAACVVSYLCFSLIPMRIASLIAVCAVTAGTGVYNVEYLFCFAPVVFACAALFFVFYDKKNQPFIKDCVFLCALVLSLACSAVSLYRSVVIDKDVSFMRPELERVHVFAVLFFVFVLFLAADSLRLYVKERSVKDKKKDGKYIKLFAVYSLMLLSFAAVVIMYYKDVSREKMSLLPLLYGTFAAVTKGTTVYFNKNGQKRPQNGSGD